MADSGLKQRVAVTLCAAGAAAAALWYCRRAAAQSRTKRKCSDPAVLAGIDEVRKAYDLSHLGFLPASCLLQLPVAFAAWEDIVAKLPELNRKGLLRQAVDAMPEVSATVLFLATPPELRRAYLILGQLAHSYAHAHEVPWQKLDDKTLVLKQEAVSLPPQLARPWLRVCKTLQMPPVLTAGATDLWNWHLLDDTRGVEYGNIALTASVTGTTTEANFHHVPCAMQAAAGEVIPKLFLADLLVAGGCDVELAALLNELTDVLREFKTIFGFVGRGVDIDTFNDIYRPLLNGFAPGGVVHEGVDMEFAASVGLTEVEPAGKNAVRVISKGPSAGQSTMIILFDIFLGVCHEQGGAEFQKEMLTYMPERHRQMVLDYQEKWKHTMPVRDYVHLSGRPRELRDAFDGCVRALRDLRRFHLATVTRYLTHNAIGTGATAWSIMLQEILHATGKCVGSCPIGIGAG